MITEIFLSVVFVLLVLLLFTNRKAACLPPGSYGLPILGDIPSSKIHIAEYVRQRMRKHGKIFTTKWGVWPMVVLTDFNQIKRLFQHPDVQGRSDMSILKIYSYYENRGVINTEGALWEKTRRFHLQNLAALGMGKTALEGSIQDEAVMLVKHLEKCVDRPASMDVFFNLAVGNVIWQLISSRRYEIDDEENIHYFKVFSEIVDFIQTNVLFLEIFPFLWKTLPTFLLNSVFKLDTGFKNVDEIYALSATIVREHMKSFDPHNPRDLIDHFALENPARDSDGFLIQDDLKELLSNMFDLFIAGSENVAAIIKWIMMYMVTYPAIQAKAHKCLDDVVPKSRLPSLSDREQLQYLDALILDAMRLCTPLPTLVLHKSTADVAFENYVIPKDTLVMACAEVCHRDPALWEKPDDLYPEHFLDEDGKLLTKMNNFLPFSIGRRVCFGEPLARMELYLFTAAILQRFTIEAPEGVTLDMESDPSQFFTNYPKPFQVVLRKRI